MKPRPQGCEEATFRRSFCLAVPELTRNADIKLNARISLLRQTKRICLSRRTISPSPEPPWQSRRAIIFRLAALFVFGSLRGALRKMKEPTKPKARLGLTMFARISGDASAKS